MHAHGAHLSCPRIVKGAYEVSQDEYIDMVMARFPEEERNGVDARSARLMTSNLGVVKQHLGLPLTSPAVAGGGKVGERNEASLEVILELTERAIKQCLAEAGVNPRDIDAIFLSNVTYWGSPGIISHLIKPCGFNPDVDKTELGSVACAGGATAYAKAFDYVTAYPDRRALVVATERLSTIIHGDDTDPMDITYGGTFGDTAGASVVSGYRADDRELIKRLGPGMVITNRHEYVMPDTLHFYRSRLDERGKGFGSNKRAPEVTAEIIPKVRAWMKSKGIPDPEWMVLHPGSKRILHVMAKSFGVDPDRNGVLRRSFDSLEDANKGAVGLLDVQRRTHADPPAHEAPGVMGGVGPGVNFVTLTGFFSRG
ncbi:hypothetical protein [Streptomyces nigrescens]